MHGVMVINACCDRYWHFLMMTPFYFVKERFSGALKYAYLKRAWVLYMKPGTVSMLRIANFNSLFY